MATEKKQTLPELMAQIAALQAEAEKVRARERVDVITRIKEAIGVYGIEARELFTKAKSGAAGRAAAAASRAAVKKPVRLASVKSKRRVKRSFTDAERTKKLTEHTELVNDGMAFDAAANKAGVSGSLLRRWYAVKGVPIPERKAA